MKWVQLITVREKLSVLHGTHIEFETVTYMMHGEMEHEDSAGNKGKLTPGDVQWMTAGKGIIHSELPTEKMMQEGG